MILSFQTCQLQSNIHPVLQGGENFNKLKYAVNFANMKILALEKSNAFWEPLSSSIFYYLKSHVNNFSKQ